MSELFNCKVIEYANGITEIRKYSKVIGAINVNQTKEEFIEEVEFGKMLSYMRNHQYLDVEEVPFIKENCWVDYFPEDLEKMDKFRKKHSLVSSFNRTVNELYKISRQCNWQYFITLTYDGAKVDRYDFDLCMKKANNWFRNQHKRYSPDLQYMFVPEQHKDGAWHVHGLLARVGNMSFVDSGKKVNGKIIYNLDGWKLGFSTAMKVYDTKGVSTYITKYITKELCEVTKGKRRYYRSRNIPEPVETCLVIEDDNDIQIIADSLGVVLDYEKRVEGYMDVDYKYYKEIEESEEKEND